MAPRKKPVRERIERLSHREGSHLMWDGQLKRGRPFLKGVGHPARALLNINTPRIQIRNGCGYPLCIDPHHFHVIKEVSRKYDDLPPLDWNDPRIHTRSPFTPKELEEIEFAVEALLDGSMTREELDEFPPAPHVKEEILKRLATQ
ncbi:hypothetical protein RZ532_22115 [Nitratireductor aquimarinus]|uniref:hypothetical protein n=1 Tax=Nitratireductor aquimarinus TaxID=889300 RepID=UPI002936CEE7|nr:hypothetical protein [Nitratireductor aquimarinus]MDV2968687.1 hypothetical protein [Nitratireductor aquimarinus]